MQKEQLIAKFQELYGEWRGKSVLILHRDE